MMQVEDNGEVDSLICRRVLGLTGTPNEDLNAWPTPDQGALGDKLSGYLKRKKAVKLYLLSGISDPEIRQVCGLSLSQVRRLITERCLEEHPDGRIYGFRALVPNLPINGYHRSKPIKVDQWGRGASGAMQLVLDLNPDLRRAFDKRILSPPSDDELGAGERTKKDHWKWFLKQLRKLGYEVRREWPFNTDNNGYVSVCRYIDDLRLSNPRKAAGVLGGRDSQKKLITGDGVDRPIHKLLQRVEMDAHKTDGRFCVMLPQADGSYKAKIIHRIWVVVLLEVISRVVLGYWLSFGREVSKFDVLRAIKRALTPWKPRKLFFSEDGYREGAGLPSVLGEKYIGLCWDETSVDGALAETCPHVRTILKDVVGSELIEPSSGFSSRRSMDDRPNIEVFFKKLASGGFHRINNTTGGKPKAKHGRAPEKIAVAGQFQVEYAEELLDLMIANYNAKRIGCLSDRSPLEYLAFLANRPGMELRYADQGEVQDILSYRKRCPVKGGLANSRRPYVHFENGRYCGDVLDQRYDLVGQDIWLVNHLEDDARVALASTMNGASLGVLRAAPPWHKLPHSLAVRKAICACIRRGLFTVDPDADAVETFLDFVEEHDGVLPIHPAYLEARRILTQAAESEIGESVLEAALAREKVATERSASTREDDSKGDQVHADWTMKLPARRKAASK